MRTLAPRRALLLAWWLASWAWAAPVPDAFPGVGAAYLVTVDDAPVFASHADRQVAPASLVKIMTALLVAERGGLEAIVAVGTHAVAATGARIGLRAGERLRVNDLLAAMLLASANDACTILAEHVGGSERAFVSAMNQRARSLGLRDTVFANACGLDARGMATSARDMATLAGIALALPAVAAWTGVETHTIRTLGGREFQLRNTNAFVGRVPGVTGLKTGYTGNAGRNLVLTAQRDATRVTVVLLGARDRWWDAAAMLERAFDTARPPR